MTESRRRCSISEVFEIRRDAKVTAAHELNNFLKLVSLFSGHADLPILQLALNLKVLRFDRLNDFLGLVPFQPLLNFYFLPGVTNRRKSRFLLLQIAQIDPAF